MLYVYLLLTYTVYTEITETSRQVAALADRLWEIQNSTGVLRSMLEAVLGNGRLTKDPELQTDASFPRPQRSNDNSMPVSQHSGKPCAVGDNSINTEAARRDPEMKLRKNTKGDILDSRAPQTSRAPMKGSSDGSCEFLSDSSRAPAFSDPLTYETASGKESAFVHYVNATAGSAPEETDATQRAKRESPQKEPARRHPAINPASPKHSEKGENKHRETLKAGRLGGRSKLFKLFFPRMIKHNAAVSDFRQLPQSRGRHPVACEAEGHDEGNVDLENTRTASDKHNLGNEPTGAKIDGLSSVEKNTDCKTGSSDASSTPPKHNDKIRTHSLAGEDSRVDEALTQGMITSQISTGRKPETVHTDKHRIGMDSNKNTPDGDIAEENTAVSDRADLSLTSAAVEQTNKLDQRNPEPPVSPDRLKVGYYQKKNTLFISSTRSSTAKYGRRYIPPCKLRSGDAISAIRRASTDACKAEIGQAACRLQASPGPGRVARTCPLNGERASNMVR